MTRFPRHHHHHHHTMNLHRAIVSSLQHDEAIVFCELPWTTHGAAVHQHIEQLLCLAWGVTQDDLDIYNIHTGKELKERSDRWPECGDVALFETGWAGRKVFYAEPARTVFLTTPLTTRELRKAQDQIQTHGWADRVDAAAMQVA